MTSAPVMELDGNDFILVISYNRMSFLQRMIPKLYKIKMSLSLCVDIFLALILDSLVS